MSESDTNQTIADWRTDAKFYRRRPGLGWLVAFLVVPALLALIGWGGMRGSDRDAELAVPSVDPSATLMPPTAPPVSAAPAAAHSPFSIVRAGDGFTLAGELPDESTRASLLDAVRMALPGATIDDGFTVVAGSQPPDSAKLGGVFGAAVEITDFNLKFDGDVITLTGTAPSEDVKAAAEAAAAATWPNVKITNDIQVSAGSATTAPPAAPGPPGPPAPPGSPAGGPCATLQADVTALLRTPVTFSTDGSTLAPDSRRMASQIAGKVKACPDEEVTVVGYTDNTGNDAINMPLSGNRAKAFADALVSDGVSADAVTSRGAGAANPVADNGTPEGRAQNRRVEITVS